MGIITKYSNIIDINNQAKEFSNATLLKISNNLFEHTSEDINKSEYNALLFINIEIKKKIITPNIQDCQRI